MNDVSRQKLGELIAVYGRSLCDDPRRCEGLLRDFCSDQKREIFVLVSALKERVPADLMVSQGGIPGEILLAGLTRRLQENLGLTEEAARWAVDSWALALGVLPPTEGATRRTRPGVPRVSARTTRPIGQGRADVCPAKQPTPSRKKGSVPSLPGGQDTCEMALIPAGAFLMGTPSDEGLQGERPQRAIYLDAYYIDLYPVTNAQYRAFCDATGRGYPSGPGWGKTYADCFLALPDYPVVNVSWADAAAYADWVGMRLPTEAEWEKAARGGLEGKRYPGGDAISHDDANYLGIGGRDRWTYASPVGSFPPNGYGLYDVAGNTWEWCSDWHDRNYYSRCPSDNPTGPATGEERVVRGGSWLNGPYYVRVAFRLSFVPSFMSNSLGFRCAVSCTP